MRSFAAVALTFALAACGSHAAPPAHTPPGPAIVALVRPPAESAPKSTEATTKVLDHKYWSIVVPTTAGWEVKDDSEEGVDLNRMDPKTGKQTASIQIVAQDIGQMSPEVFIQVAPGMVKENILPAGVEITGVKGQHGHWKDHTSSVVQMLTDAHVFVGVLTTVDEVNHTGYMVIAIGPMTQADADLLSSISRTFELKTPPPPADDSVITPPEFEKTPSPKK